MTKKEKELKNRQNKMNELMQYTRNGVVRYDFFEATDKITVLNPISENDKEIIGIVNKGDALMRVGEGLVCGNLPIETMYFLKYDKLLKGGYIKQIKDPATALALSDAFKKQINNIEIKITSDVLTYITSYEEFIRIPEEIKPNIKKQIDNILK